MAIVLISASHINSLAGYPVGRSSPELAYSYAHDNFRRCQPSNLATCGVHIKCFPPNAPDSWNCTIYRTSLIFDLSSIPIGATINTVKLTVKFRWEGFGTISKDWDVIFKKNNDLTDAECGAIPDKQAEYMELLQGTEFHRFPALDIIGGWHEAWEEKTLIIDPSVLSGLNVFKLGIVSSDDIVDDCPDDWKGRPNDVLYEQTRLLSIGNGKWCDVYGEWLDDVPELEVSFTLAPIVKRKGNIIIDQLIYQHTERMRV